MKAQVLVVAAAILDDGLILGCRRAPGRAAAGKWEFPGGKVEDGEEPSVALRREVFEELNIEVLVGDLINRTQTEVGEFIIDLATYNATLANQRPVHSTDHDRLAWFALDELDALDWASPDLPVVAALLERSSS